LTAPLRVLRIATRSFRNLAPLDLAPGARFNVVFGDNGQGKSNLLEAIHLCASLSSFRGAGASELIRHDAESAIVALELSGIPLPHTLKMKLDRSKARQLALDGKRPRTRALWLDVAGAVLFHPGDLALAQGSPENRRALLDRVLSEVDPIYATTLEHYGKALRSRNRLLKADVVDRRAVAAFDPVLAATGAVLGEARKRLVGELAPVAEKVFEEIVGEQIPLVISFAPRVGHGESELREALARSIDKDVARGFTAEGPHADDVKLEVAARGAKHNASQGQQRALVLALKVAELDVIARAKGRVPMLLLDDVSSELDRTRSARLFALLSRLGGQVFLTTTQRELITTVGDRVDLRVEAGRVSVC
jgi:DNA replication and repair protein RecF